MGVLGTLLRCLGVVRVLLRHDALRPFSEAWPWPLPRLVRMLSAKDVRGRPGQRVVLALVELGPTFIKLGQTLATRGDLMGPTLAADLADLQDRLPAFPFEAVRKSVEEELEAPLEAVFARFEETPVSAASIAQVHLAETPEGEAVAVKVLRPGIEAAFARDVAFIGGLARIAQSLDPRLSRLRLDEVVELFATTVDREMDLRLEAAAASELAENFADDPTYRVPSVDWERTGRRVMTQSRVGGIPMDDREALLAAGHDIEEVLTKAAAIFFQQVFRDGFFHGDQHPGNMMVDAEGAIVAVDFGIMGRLDRSTRIYLADMLLGLLARDYRRVAEIQAEAGYVPADVDLDSYAQALRALTEPVFGRRLEDISFARVLGGLLQLTQSYSLAVQPQLLLLQKNMLMAEGVSRTLDSGLNVWTLAEPLIVRWMQDNRGPGARARQAARDLADLAERLPRTVARLDRALEEVEEQGFRLHPETSRNLARGSGRGRVALAFWSSLAALAVALVALLA